MPKKCCVKNCKTGYDMLENEVGGRSCQLCLYEMDVEATDVLDNLLELEDSIPLDVKMSFLRVLIHVL